MYCIEIPLYEKGPGNLNLANITLSTIERIYRIDIRPPCRSLLRNDRFIS